MIRDRERLAALISAENGEYLADAAGEVAYAAEFFRWLAEEAVRLLTGHGLTARRAAQGILEWKLAGLPFVTGAA